MENKKKSPIKALVMGEYIWEDHTQILTAVGAYENITTAYGEAYLFLVADLDEDEETGSSAGTPYMVTEPWGLEGDTGYGLSLKNKKGEVERRVYILFNDQEVEDGTE